MGRKVCIVGTAHPFRGGMADFNHRLAQAFLANGDEVEIINFTTQYPGFLFPGKTQFSEDKPPEGLKIQRKLSSVNPISWISAGLIIRKMKPDILMVNYWLPLMAPAFGSLIRVAVRNRKTRVLSVVHNIIPHEKRIGDYWFSKYFSAAVDGFLTLSRSVLKDLDAFDKTKPRQFNPHPLYDHYGEPHDRRLAKIQLGLDPDKKHLLFFGFIRDYKGLDLLLKAMKPVKERLPGVELVVAGEFYSSPDSYHQIIKDLQIDEYVNLHTDFISSERVGLYFSAADLVVQPYKTATQSGVTQIAYHFNKPMVVTNVGGLGELVPHEIAGLVVDPEPAAIAMAVEKYFREQKESVFVENIKELKKMYSWKKLIAKLNQLDEKVINQKR
ncbi:MAG TPA: glycosyltransferase [Bacteroidales bacterium]|nr:glycosyltransferase [Bacteroidales bacterium]